MGFLDSLLGRRKIKGPAPDRLFALATAYVHLSAAHQIETRGAAAIVFQPLPTADFDQITSEVEELVRSTGEETGTILEQEEDPYGYRWMIVRDDDLEDQVVNINAVSDALEVGGYGDRVLCAVFGFRDARGQDINLIYNYKRGTWYPFVPAEGDKQRSNERELQIQALIGQELPIEPLLERWFPLWGIPI